MAVTQAYLNKKGQMSLGFTGEKPLLPLKRKKHSTNSLKPSRKLMCYNEGRIRPVP